MNITLRELSSYLGESPICDVCKQPVVIGDRVRQQFIGIVGQDPMQHGITSELGISEESYTLVHVACEQRN